MELDTDAKNDIKRIFYSYVKKFSVYMAVINYELSYLVQMNQFIDFLD